ncbi:hypothetical protein N7474_007012 [Penicillium riverlandense]|uniref:uncharacterized protein n=1 Tax=Penicillium riverlandense TaxID=1903569 RepID=UPI002547B887|nr:uncharacterized protein N7474_007012 [Penicillium riverlandense]KAJ5815235.1 hypothetical protein N7474_007012 [Penicillium riverlandense]
MDFALPRVQDTSNLQNWMEAPHTPPESKTTVWVTDYFTEVIHPTYTEIIGPAPSSWDIPLFPTSTPNLDPFTTLWSSEVAAGQTTLATESSTPSQLPESHTSAPGTEQPVETNSSNTIESSTTSTSSEESESTTLSKTSSAFDTSTTSDTSTSDSTTTSEASRISDTTTRESPSPARPSMQPLVTLATAPPLPSQSGSAGFLPAATEYGSTTGEDASGHAGVIAGSIVGGVAFIALTLLACFFCYRRKKRQRSQPPKRPTHMREASFDSWNASSLMGSIRVLKYRQFSQPDCVDTDSPPGLGPHAQKHADDQTAGGRPVPYRQRSGVPRQYSNRRYSNPYVNYSDNPEMSGANNDMSYSDGNPYPNGTNPHRVSSQISSRWAPSSVSDPFADDASPVSPIIDLNAPSRTVSCYSRASYHGGLNILAHYDGSARDSQCASTYFYPGQLSGDSTDHLPPVPPIPDGISRTGSILRGRSQNFSSPLAQFGGEHSDPWDLQQPLPAVLRSGPRRPPPRGGLF